MILWTILFHVSFLNNTILKLVSINQDTSQLMTGRDIGTVYTLHLYSCTLLVLLKNKHVLKSNDVLKIVLAIILGVKTVQYWPLLLTDFFDFIRLVLMIIQFLI